MHKNIKRNYFYNMLYEILVLLTPLITTPYISRVLQPEGVGLYSYSYSIVTYFILFAGFGSIAYGRRQVAFCCDDKKAVTRVFLEVLILRVLFTAISIVFYLILIINSDNKILFAAQGIFLISVAFDISWFFQGLEEFGTVVFRNILIKLLNIVYIFIFVRSQDDLIIYVIGLSTMTLLGNITIWPLLKKYICKIYLNELNPLCHFKEMLQLFVPTIAIQVYTVLDKTMIGLFCDDSAENGYYEQSEKIVKMVLTVITSLSAVMVPRISSTFAKGDNDSVKSYMYKSYRFVWFLGLPMVTGLICVSDYFVPWFLGEGFDKASLLIKLLSFLILAIGLNTITGQQFLISTKRQIFYTVSVCIGAAVNVILNLILIPHFFSIGAALGTLAAETIICIVQFIYVSYWKYYSVMKIMCMSVKYIVASLIMGICITALKWIVSQDIIGTFILIVSGVAVYTALLVVFRDDLLMSAIKGIFKKIKHRA